ncbi:hypothetical protein H671_xg20308 [Cricetulus griseus]|uniref:Uncharacterized protein n=1 Tax=Cricetulus griseus TaxID=10029 RepID=A0A061HXS9_CRIGR|nr:hypothetical protein H671_xg20308 [Cricetulus griseus]
MNSKEEKFRHPSDRHSIPNNKHSGNSMEEEIECKSQMEWKTPEEQASLHQLGKAHMKSQRLKQQAQGAAENRTQKMAPVSAFRQPDGERSLCPPLRNKAQVDSLRILKLENVNTKQGTHVCVAILSSTKICGSLTTHILCVKNLNELLGDYDSELQCDNA